MLVLYSDERLLPANIIIDEAIRAAFAVGTNNRVEFYSEFLDVSRFPGEEQQQRQRDFLRDKYRERPPDLVIAVSGGALVFLAEHRADLFTGVPIVYCSVAGDPHPDHLSDARIAEVPVPDGVAPTLEMMLRLHPDTRQVAVVSGSGPRDRQMADTFRQEMTTFGNRVAFTWLTNLSMEELRGELSRLPDHTVVLYLTMFQDAAGKTFTPRQALEAFAPASRAPIYGFYDTYLGHGIVGGSMVTFEEIGRKAAQLGIRILAGEDAQAAARSESYQAVPMFDWRQLRRWNISEQRLPPGSIIRFKEATYWEQHYRIIVAALSLCLLEALLIVALLVQLRRRRRAESGPARERAADESCRRLPPTLASGIGTHRGRNLGERQVAGVVRLREVEAAGTGLLSPKATPRRSRSSQQNLGEGAPVAKAGTRWNIAWCCRTAGCVGSLPVAVSSLTPLANSVLMRGVSLDNTSRKQAEEAAHDLSGRLIYAQERSRRGSPVSCTMI